MKLVFLFIFISLTANAATKINEAKGLNIPATARVASSPIKISPNLTVLDHWFFSGPKNKLYERSKINSDAAEIKVDQIFGVGMICTTTKKTVNIKIELHVPSKPENFKFNIGKVTISPDKKWVTVEIDDSCKEDENTYYWGIGPDDPSGNYELKLSVEGVAIEIYKFLVPKTQKKK